MSFTLRKVAGTAVLVVAASGLTLPLAPVAQAVGTPVEAEYFISDTNGDFSYELWARPAPNGTAFPVAGDTTHDIDNLTFSQDGSRLAYMQRTLNSSGDPVSTQIVVRDVSDQLVRVVASVSETTGEDSAPSLSPDGNTVAWTNVSANGWALYRAGVGTGTPVLVKGGYKDGTFVDGSTLLAKNASDNTWATVTLAGVVAANSALDSNSFDVAVSEDGLHLVWAQDTSVSTTSTSDIETATLSVTGGVATIGSPVQVATGLANEAPSFSQDGSKVYFIRWDGDTGNGDIWSAPTVPDGANPPAVSVVTATEDDYDVAIGTTDDGTAPNAAGTAVAAVLSGTSATVKWTLPSDADLSGVKLQRYAGVGTAGTLQKTVAYLPTPASPLSMSYVDTGLALGATYTYAVTTIDRSGNTGTAATRSLTALAAAPTQADPTSTASTKASFPVTFAATAPTSAKFTVDSLVVGTTTWRRWVTAVPGRIRTFGVASTTAGVASTTSTPGTNYVFRVQVTDAYGNTSALVSGARAVVPFDQTKATLSGGTNYASSSSYLGSFRQLKTTASYAKVVLTGNRLQVIGIKCAACGKFAIYLGSTKVATVDTYSSSTRVRAVLYTATYTTVASRTYTIRPLATAGRPSVELDGFAMRR